MNVEAIGLAVISAVAGALLAWLVVKARYGQELATRGERLRLLELNQDGMRLELVQAQRTQQQLHEQLASLGRELATATTRLEEERRQAEEKISLLREMSDTSRKALTDEFKNLANSIFEDKSKRFTEQNLEGLGQILTPFRERLTEFKTRVEEMHHQDAQQQASLKTELTQLKELNRQMTEEAHSLATALKGQSKMQGNWGELVLENVLARSGLQADRDYRREVSFTTESGRQRPDVIVYLPQQKHLIIDAKVSLNAYTRYVNADDELDRKAALREHVQAVSDRITELADRRYFDLGELNSPDMVFMFIPIESAFVEAMRADEQLFQKALERNVLVATPTTLLTSLNIVRQLWRFEHQNAHSAELADSASQLYQKFLGFISSMEDLGRKLDSAKASFTTAYSQLYSGRGNLIKRAKDFERLGVAVQKELPQDLVDKAELELDYLPSVDELNSDDKDRAA
ncbi:MAG: DNA recombination protein RmuC [Polynucleobacter sp.]|jgi:DNA recombination protein RmuC|nr:DNA recombination protein RmuC [Polynucleobacter sp.]